MFPAGPYSPGQAVTVNYTLGYFYQLNVNWVIAFQINLGAGAERRRQHRNRLSLFSQHIEDAAVRLHAFDVAAMPKGVEQQPPSRLPGPLTRP